MTEAASLKPLERLGLEVVAFTLLGSRWQAAMLLTLLDANGQICGWRRLAAARAWRNNTEDSDSTRNGTRIRICFLRRSLEDLGLDGVIVTAPRASVIDRADGYSLPEPGRSAVLARLIEEAGA
jgi:hypothetical protein